MNPYVFFVGCPRSGTTLLRRIGGAHPELAIIPELHWLPRWWERRVGLTEEGMVTPKLVARLRRHPRLPRLELDPSSIDAVFGTSQPKHYAHFVTQLFDLHGEVKGKRLVGEKTPEYVRSLPTLTKLWPRARIVHLIRDGRDVALSLQDWANERRAAGRFPSWDEDPVTTSALFWEWNVRLGREKGELLGSELYHELRYEALVSDPELACRELCGFLAIDYDPAMLRFHEGRMTKEREPRRPVTPGLRRWRDQMARDDVGRFEAAAGALLDELGYERVAPQASVDERMRVARLRKAFEDRARSLRWDAPEAWVRQAA